MKITPREWRQLTHGEKMLILEQAMSDNIQRWILFVNKKAAI